MEIRETVESIAREVIRSMKAEKEKQNRPNVLFIFCDSTAHEAYRDDFIKLKKHDICYDLLFLDGETSSWLGLHRVECNGAGKVIVSDENAPAPIELPKKYDGIVIPEIDLDNAARITAGLKGTVKSEIVFSALVLQKFIILGKDVPGIKRSDRRCLNQLVLPDFYQKRFQQYMKDMKKMGIEFSSEKALIDTVIDKLKVKKQEEEPTDKVQTGGKDFAFRGKLLTADWLQSQTDFPEQTVFLRKGAIVSPLARDLLKDKGLTVQYVNE